MSFPHEELMEIIGKLDKKLEEVENIIDFKKGETNKMIERTVHGSHMKGLSAIQGLDIYVLMEYSRRTLEGGVDEFSFEELMNIIDLKKGETNSMNEHTVHGSHMKGLPAIQGLDIYVPMPMYYSGRTLEDGVDEFSFEELMENIGKLDNKLEEVENIIDLKKGKTNSMNELTVHCSHMKGLPAIQPLDSYIAMCPWITQGGLWRIEWMSFPMKN